MFNKNKKFLILGILIVAIIAIAYGSLSSYARDVNTVITLNVIQPTYKVRFHNNIPETEDSYVEQEFTYGVDEAFLKVGTDTEFDIPAFVYTGHKVLSWNTSGDGQGDNYSVDYNESTLSSDNGAIIDIYAQWGDIELVTYSVIHRWQDVVGDGYTVHETETIEAEVGSSVTPMPKYYEGFKLPNLQTATVNAGESTVITYDYDRKEYYVTFDYEDLIVLTNISDISSPFIAGNYRYGHQFKIEFDPHVPDITFQFDDYLVTEIDEDGNRNTYKIDKNSNGNPWTELDHPHGVTFTVEQNLIVEPEFSSYPYGIFVPFNGTPWIDGAYATNHADVYNNLYTNTSSLQGLGPLQDPSVTSKDEFMFGDLSDPTNGISKKQITEFKRNVSSETNKTIDDIITLYHSDPVNHNGIMLVSNETDADPDLVSPIEVYAWVENNKMYWESRAYIVKFHPDTIAPFYAMCAATSIDLNHLDTSMVKNFTSFFNSCLRTTEIKGYINTSGVVNPGLSDTYPYGTESKDQQNDSSFQGMSYMFNDCKALESLDVSKFDTQNVVDMKRMFAGCSTLTKLDLFSFDTSNVKSLYWMFRKCRRLNEVRITSFDTRNVENMYGMFQQENGGDLKRVYFGVNFKTPKVKNTSLMFAECNKLETIYAINDFEQESITSYSDMFKNCKVLVGGRDSGYETYYGANPLDPSYSRANQGNKGKDFAKISNEDQMGYFTHNSAGSKYYIDYELSGGYANNRISYYQTTATFALIRPTREGYIFTGWTGSNGDVPQLDVIIPEGSVGDRTYVAHWEPITYTVEFDANGGEGTTMTSQVFTYDVAQNLSANTYTFTDKDFSYWSTNPDGTGNRFNDKASVLNIANIDGTTLTLYANWRVSTYTISYNYGNYSFNGSNYLDTGLQIYSEENFERDLHISFSLSNFTYCNQNGNSSRNVFLCATYEAIAPYPGFSIQYRHDKANQPANNDKVYFQADSVHSGYLGNFIYDPEAQSACTINILREDGYVYINGNHAIDGVNGTDVNLNDISNSNKEIMKNSYVPLAFGAQYFNGSYRRYSKIDISNLVVKLDYSEEDMDDRSNIVIPTTLTYQGHTFDGWYTEPNGGGTKITSADQLTQIHTILYANWIAN